MINDNIFLDSKYKFVWGIYALVNIENNKQYFGSSKNLHKRLLDHLNLLKKKKHNNFHLQNSFIKYGEDKFMIKIIKTFTNITEKELRDQETKYIQDNKTFLSKYGYNQTSVALGTSSDNFSEERRRKISESNKGRVAPNKGVRMKESQKKLLKKINSEKYGKFINVYSELGDFIEELPTVTETAIKYNCIKRDIIDCCKGRRSVVKHYIFRYKNKEHVKLSQNYEKNKTRSLGIFIIYNYDNNELIKIKYIKDLEKYFNVSQKHKYLQKLTKKCYNGEIVTYKNCNIKYINNALNSSDAIEELRQLSKKLTKGTIDDCANGEA